MPTNLCTPFYEPASRVTGRPTADVTGKRFVKVSGPKDPGSLGLDAGASGGNVPIAPAGAGDKWYGVAEADCPANGKQSSVVTVFRGGFIVPIPAAVPLAPGDFVVPAAAGKAGKAADQTAAGRALAAGMVLGGGTVADQDAIVALF
jgi:hypothetical protein